VDQHGFRRKRGKAFQSPQSRFLTRCTSCHWIKKLKAGRRNIVKHPVGLTNDDPDRVNSGMIDKQANSTPQNRLAAEGLILLGNAASESFALSSGDEQRCALDHLS
jgi:hypothetical protein